MSHSNPENQPEWYVQKRREIVSVFAMAQPGETLVRESPSGAYRLEVTLFSTGPASWQYSRGRVFRANDHVLIAQVDRNFGAFPYSWCESHPTGKSYLVCGEDYQCQTVLELPTGRRIDYVDPATQNGGAFCWAAHYPSPDGRFMFVDGCYWACPYELVLFDFTRPMELPYRELRRWPLWEVNGYASDGSFTFEYRKEVRRRDDKPLEELSETEDRALFQAADWSALIREKRYRITWKPDGSEEEIELD